MFHSSARWRIAGTSAPDKYLLVSMTCEQPLADIVSLGAAMQLVNAGIERHTAIGRAGSRQSMIPDNAEHSQLNHCVRSPSGFTSVACRRCQTHTRLCISF